MPAATSLARRVHAGEVLTGEVKAAVRRSPLAGPTHTVRAPEGASLADMAAIAIPEPGLRAFVVASIDGVEIPRDQWAHRRPRAGDAVTLIVRPGGDEGGEILRTILSIVLVVVVSVISEGAWTPAALDWAAGFIAAGVAVAGNLAINALVPLAKPALEAQKRDFYNLAGARNGNPAWQPFPVLFGEHRFVPPLYGRWVQETDGDRTWLRIPFCYGKGRFEIVERRIGDTLLSAYDGVEIESRLTPDAKPHALYVGDPDQETLGSLIDETFATHTTVAGVDEISVIVGFRTGLGGTDEKGRKVANWMDLQLEYRLHGTTGDWLVARPTGPQVDEAVAIAAGGSPGVNRFNYGATTPALLAYKNALDDVSSIAQGLIPVRRSQPGEGFTVPVSWAVPRGQYDVRLRRTTPESTDAKWFDACWWEVLGSRKSYVNPFPDPAVASEVLRILATDQLQGVVDQYNVIIRKLIPVFSGTAKDDPQTATAASLSGYVFSTNCAEVGLDSVRGPHNALPKADSEIDWPSWAAFADWCETEGLTFNEPVTNAISRGAQLRKICQAGHGMPVRINGKLAVVIDRSRAGEAASQVFTPRNVSGLRWTKTFPAEVHGVRIAFANAASNWLPDEVTLYVDGYDATNATRLEKMEIPGKTDADELIRVGTQYLRNALTQTERWSLSMDAESVTATYGAYVHVQHDALGVGIGSARVRDLVMGVGDDAGLVAGVRLDTPIDTEAGPALACVWRRILVDGDSGRMEVGGEEAIARDADDARIFMFASPIAPEDAPEPAGDDYEGDLISIGEATRVTIEGLVRGIDPDDGDRARLTLVAYAGERFEPGELPPHDPKTSLPLSSRPATPVLLQANARSRQIVVNFLQPTSPRGVRVTGFRTWLREHPADSDGAPDAPADPGDAGAHGGDAWTPAGLLEADQHQVMLPAGDPGASYDVRIVALGLDNGGLTVLSDPLDVLDIPAENDTPAPAGCHVGFEIRTSSAGARQVVAIATWTPEADPDIQATRIYLLDADEEWAEAGSGAASAGLCEIHGLPVGRSYTFGFVNVTRRGAESDRVEIDPVAAPDVLGATEAGAASPDSPLADELEDIATSFILVNGRIDDAEEAIALITGAVGDDFTDLIDAIVEANNRIDDAEALLGLQGTSIGDLEVLTATQATAITGLQARAVSRSNLIPDLADGPDGWILFGYTWYNAWNGPRLQYNGAGIPTALSPAFAAPAGLAVTAGANKLEARGTNPVYIQLAYFTSTDGTGSPFAFSPADFAVDDVGRIIASNVSPATTQSARVYFAALGNDTGYTDLTSISAVYGSADVPNPTPGGSLRIASARITEVESVNADQDTVIAVIESRIDVAESDIDGVTATASNLSSRLAAIDDGVASSQTLAEVKAELQDDDDDLAAGILAAETAIADLELTKAEASSIIDLYARTSARTNLIPNGDLSNGIDGWSLALFGLETAWNGPRLSYNGTGVPTGLSPAFRVQPGFPFTAGSNKFDNRATNPVYVQLVWYTSFDGTGTPTFSAEIDATPDAFNRIAVTATPPGGMNSARVWFAALGSDTGYTDLTSITCVYGSVDVPNAPAAASAAQAAARIQTLQSVTADLEASKAEALDLSLLTATVTAIGDDLDDTRDDVDGLGEDLDDVAADVAVFNAANLIARMASVDGGSASSMTLEQLRAALQRGDSIHDNFRDEAFWNLPVSGAYLSDIGVGWTFTRVLGLSSGSYDLYSDFFPAEPGATYRIRTRIWTNAGGWTGYLHPIIHMPLVQWFSLKHGHSVDPAVHDASNAIVAAGDTGDLEWIVTNPTGVTDSANRAWQFRFLGSFTGGPAIIACDIVRLDQYAAVTAAEQAIVDLDIATASALAAVEVITDDLQARVSTLDEAFIDSGTGLALARFVKIASATGGRPARFGLYSDSEGTSDAAIDAARIFFGDDTYFDDASNTFISESGGVRRRYGDPFGAAGDLLYWIGLASVDLGDETPANGTFAQATDTKTYKDGVALGGQATANFQRGSSYTGTPTEGSWWADTSVDKLKCYTGGAWQVVADIQAATVFSASAATANGTRSGSGTVNTPYITLTPSGVSGTAEWYSEFVSGDTFTISFDLAGPIRVRGTTSVTVGQDKTGYYRISLRDSATGLTSSKILRFQATETS